MHSLDRPVWASLSTHHAVRSEGNALARRFARDVNVFASARDDSPQSVAALGALVRTGESVYLAQVGEVVIPPGLHVARDAPGVQMVARTDASFEPQGADMLLLGDADAAEMLALARLTEPGPFLERTHSMGTFLGIRIGGRLVAMAGERMRWPGFTELSGVCTHPDFRGGGLARRLSAAIAAGIRARGDTPILHAWKSNETAIALYTSLGFRLRTEIRVVEITRP